MGSTVVFGDGVLVVIRFPEADLGVRGAAPSRVGKRARMIMAARRLTNAKFM